jgi:hypothetical protein
MNRYIATSIIKNDNGTRKFSTIIIPNIMADPLSDFYIKTTSIERLDKLAQQFYNDASMWWIIAAANGIGKGTLVIPTDTDLRIPSAQNAMNMLINLNKTR